MNNDQGKIWYGIGLDNRDLQTDAAQTKSIFKSIGNAATAEGARIDNTFKKVGAGVAAFFTIREAASFAKEIANIRGEFQMLEISFTTMLGSKAKSDALMGQLVRTAAITPFDLKGVAAGAKQLLAYGESADTVNGTLIRLGNIASGLNIPLNDLVYLYGTTMVQGRLFAQDVRQFQGRGIPLVQELGKALGKTTEEINAMVSAGKIGFPEVQRVINSLTDEGGMFFNLMAEQSKSIPGQISNLGDSFAMMLNEIGKANQDIISGGISGARYLVDNYQQVTEILAMLVTMYGAYKAALIATAAIHQTTDTVKRTEEASELFKLLSAEQQAKVSKMGLAKTSAEYAAAIRAEIRVNTEAAAVELAKARAEVSGANQTMAAKRAEYVAAKELEAQRIREFAMAQASGNAKRISNAESKLAAATASKEAAAVQFQASARDFSAKRTAVENAAKAANTLTTNVNTASQTANVTVTNMLSVAKTKLIGVATKLNAVLMSNVWGIALAAVVALAYGIYKLVTYQTEAEKAQSKLNDAVNETNKNIDSEAHQIDSMFARLKNAKQGTDEYRAAKEAIMSRYGEYLKKLGDEKTALNDVAAAHKLVAEEAKKAANARGMESFIQNAADTLAGKEVEAKKEVQKLLENKYKGEKGPDGISLSETYFWKIKPVIEGKSKITPEIEKILKDFDEKHEEKYVDGVKVMDAYISNVIKDQIDKAAEARGVYNKAMLNAQKEFGENPNTNAFDVSEFDVTNASLQQLMDQLDKAKEELKVLKKEQSNPTAIKDAEEYVENIKNAILEREKELRVVRELEERIKDLRDEQKEYAADDAEYKDIEARIQDLQSKLPKTGKEIDKEESDKNQQKLDAAARSKQIQEYGDKVAREYEKAEHDIRQRTIDAMDDGIEKQKAQIQLNYDKLELENKERIEAMVKALQENERLEWENANPNYKQEGLVFTPTKTEKDLSESQKDMIKAYTDAGNEYKKHAESELLKQETEAMNKYLSLYGDYQQRKLAITELYNQKIAAATATGEKLTLGEQMKKELYDLDMEVNKTTSSIGKLFGDMRNLAASDLRKIADDAEKALNFVQEGKWDEAKGLSLGISKETFDTLRKSPEEMGKVRDGIDRIRESADKLEPALTRIIIGIKNLFHSGGDTEEFQKALEEINSGLNDMLQLGGFLSDVFSNLGDALGSDALSGIAEGIGVAMDTVNSAMQGAQAGAMFGPIGAAAGAALGAVSSLVSSIARIHDKKHERQIERLQDQIDTLERTYDKLGKSVDKAYSSDASRLIAQQNKMLERQKRLIEQQIREEESKKKTDQNRIKEWREQIEDINETIADNKEKQIDAIFGQDIQSAIDDFAQAYADAWTNNEDRTKTAADFIRNQIRNAITEAIKADISSPIDAVRKKISEFMGDGRISDDEQAYLDSIIQQEVAKLDGKYAWADKYFKETGNRDAVSSGIAQASQDSVDELNGRFAAIQGHTFGINESVKVLAANSSQVLRHLAGIEYNTARLETIEAGISSIRAGINDMNIKGIKLR